MHGVGGVWGLVAAGIFATGYPNMGEAPPVTLIGQLTSAAVFIALGLGLGFVLSWLLKIAGLLRVPDDVQLVGLDKIKVPIPAYPEFERNGYGRAPAE